MIDGLGSPIPNIRLVVTDGLGVGRADPLGVTLRRASLGTAELAVVSTDNSGSLEIKDWSSTVAVAFPIDREWLEIQGRARIEALSSAGIEPQEADLTLVLGHVCVAVVTVEAPPDIPARVAEMAQVVLRERIPPLASEARLALSEANSLSDATADPRVRVLSRALILDSRLALRTWPAGVAIVAAPGCKSEVVDVLWQPSQSKESVVVKLRRTSDVPFATIGLRFQPALPAEFDGSYLGLDVTGSSLDGGNVRMTALILDGGAIARVSVPLPWGKYVLRSPLFGEDEVLDVREGASEFPVKTGPITGLIVVVDRPRGVQTGDYGVVVDASGIGLSELQAPTRWVSGVRTPIVATTIDGMAFAFDLGSRDVLQARVLAGGPGLTSSSKDVSLPRGEVTRVHLGIRRKN